MHEVDCIVVRGVSFFGERPLRPLVAHLLLLIYRPSL